MSDEDILERFSYSGNISGVDRARYIDGDIEGDYILELDGYHQLNAETAIKTEVNDDEEPPFLEIVSVTDFADADDVLTGLKFRVIEGTEKLEAEGSLSSGEDYPQNGGGVFDVQGGWVATRIEAELDTSDESTVAVFTLDWDREGIKGKSRWSWVIPPE